jgi:hypothetical protein
MSNKNTVLDVSTGPINGRIYNYIVSKGSDHLHYSCSTDGNGYCHNPTQDPSQLYLTVLSWDAAIDPIELGESTMSQTVVALTDGYKQLVNTFTDGWG